MIDPEILKEVERIAKEKIASGGKPMGDLAKLNLATKLQTEKISEEACAEIKELLVEITGKVSDLRSNDIPTGSLKAEYLKLGTALGISRTKPDAPKPRSNQPKAPTPQEREAAILLAFKDGTVKPLKSGHYPKALIHNRAVEILKEAGARIIVSGDERVFNLSPTQVQAPFANLCQASVALTQEDIDTVTQITGQVPRGTPVKIALKKTVEKDTAALTAAKKRITEFKERISQL
jgi:hypothetical protein